MAFGFSMSKTKVSPIAIDLGADSVKLLQVAPGQSPADPPQLVGAAAVRMPEDVRFDPAARNAYLNEALRDAVRRPAVGEFRGKRAALSFPAFQTLMQHLEVGRAEGAELENQVGLALRQRLNIEPTRMVIRHFPVRPLMRDGVNLQEVICLAASKDVVMGYIELARACKLDVVGMHCEPVAILKTFEHLYRGAEDQDRVVCFIDIGAATTKVVIAHGTRMVFAKSIHVGGDNITKELAEARRCGFAEAYQARLGGGGVPLAPPGGAPTPRMGTGIPMLDAQMSRQGGGTAVAEGGDDAGHDPAADTIDTIVDELQLCLRYHATMFPEKTVERLVFIGGEARQTGVCQAVAKAVRIAAQLGDPFARLSRIGAGSMGVGLDLSQPQPGWAVPMGLCLSEASA